MTIINTKKRAAGRIKVRSLAFFIIVILLVFLTFFKSRQIKEYAIYGMRLCCANIIPTLFPFLIFSDLLMLFGAENTFLKNGISLPFLLGALCGFPVGAICVINMLRSGTITEKRAEILIPISSVPSVAFIISGVGGGMLKDTLGGILLWISVVLSSLIVYIIFNKKGDAFQNKNENIRQNFNIVASIRSAGVSMLSICSFIIFFSVVCGLVCSPIKNDLLSDVISALLEVGNASSKIAASSNYNRFIRYVLLSFALSFSGISVYMQILSVLENTRVSCHKFLFYKLIQGIISAIIILLLLLLFDFFKKI